MKKINSINVSGKVIGVISIFLVFLPFLFYCLRFIGLEVIGEMLMKISLGIGVVISAVAWTLLMIELKQDKRLDQYYSSHAHCKNKPGENKYECQNCGNREVEKKDTYCKVCGILFEKYEE